MEIIPRLKLTKEELGTLKEAREIFSNICDTCHCDLESCPLYCVCLVNDSHSTMDDMLDDIINEVVTE